MSDYESDVSILGDSPCALKEKEEVLLSWITVANVLPVSLKYSVVVCSSQCLLFIP